MYPTTHTEPPPPHQPGINGFVRTEKPATDGWQTPDPLIAGSESAQYPLPALPGIIGGAIREVVDIVKCPPALAANSALSVLAVAGQGLANVKPNPNLKSPSPLSLYTLSIGESGERKTTADNFFSSVLDTWAQQKQQEVEADVIKSKACVSAWEREVEGIKQAIQQAGRKGEDVTDLTNKLALAEQTKPEALRTPDMIHEDATPEAIAYELVHTWPSAGILSGEAGVVFGGHGMKADNIARNLGTINKLWEGGAIPIKRRGIGGSFHVRDVRLSMGLAVQPSVIRDFYETNGDMARGSGFAARFLLAWPESTQGQRFLSMEDLTTQHPKRALNLFYSKLHEVLERQYSNAQAGKLANLPTLQLSPQGLKVWLDYFNDVERELQAGGDMEHFRDIASKSADNAARIAGLFHIFNGGDLQDTIHADIMEVAAGLACWHLNEARRFFGEIAVPTDLANAIRLDGWLLQYCQHQATDHLGKREIRQYAPNKLRSKATLDEALEELEARNRIRLHLEGRKEIIEVNPQLLGASHGLA